MVGKRIIRIAVFLVVNVGLLWLLAIVFEELDEYCSNCAYLEKSNSIQDSRNTGNFIESYQIVNSDFPDNNIDKSKFTALEIWKETTRMIPNNGSKPSEKELIVWSKIEDELEYQFRLKTEDNFENINSMWSYWEPKLNLTDTIKLGVFRKENISVGELSYIKVN